MSLEYNTQKEKLVLPEYGRNVQQMVDYCVSIPDREERTRCAYTIIQIMGNLFPQIRDSDDYKHKLWDHLFIMSDFKLDVDSPYPRPSRQDLTVSPHKMAYPQERIAYKHYGKYVARMLRVLRDEKDREALDRAVDSLARYMRTKSFEYNQEHPNNEVIIKDIKQMSEGGIELDEVALNNLRSDYKQHLPARQQKGQQQRQQKASAKSPMQKGSFTAQKNRQGQGPQKNNREGVQRYNSQK